jgi:hypothetical protein
LGLSIHIPNHFVETRAAKSLFLNASWIAILCHSQRFLSTEGGTESGSANSFQI